MLSHGIIKSFISSPGLGQGKGPAAEFSQRCFYRVLFQGVIPELHSNLDTCNQLKWMIDSMRRPLVALDTKHSKSGNVGRKCLQITQTPWGSPGLCWEPFLGKDVALGGNKVRLHYSRMKKQSPKLEVIKWVTCTYEDALSGYFCFPTLIVMDTEKYFLHQEREQG